MLRARPIDIVAMSWRDCRDDNIPIVHRLSGLIAILFAGGCATGGAAGARSNEPSIDTHLSQIAAFRKSNHRDAALVELDRLLKRLGQAGGVETLPESTRAALDVEIRDADETVGANIGRHAAAGHPLTAEAELARRAPLLTTAAFAPTRQASAEAIRQAGQQVCQRLQETVTPELPYWGLGVSRYCEHFGVTFPPPSRAGALGSFEVTGQISGVTAVQSEAFRARVGQWLHDSLWFDEGGKAVGRGTVDGSYSATHKRQSVTLHATYKQKITTTTIGSLAPPLAPTTPRGVTPPLRRYPGTSYSTTTMDQTFPYDAEEIRGDYALGVSVKIDVGTPAPLTVNVRRGQGIKGYDHDVIFEPAGIVPRHDRVPSAAEWFDDQVESMSRKMVWALNRKFIDAHCKRASFEVNEAVRCLAVGQQAPGALAALANAIGEGAEPLVPILRPAPKPEPEAPTKKPAPAKVRPKVSSGATDDEDPIID
jgi:hypothetical protein